MKFELRRDLSELKSVLIQKINAQAQQQRDQILTPGVPYADKRNQALMGEGPYVEIEARLRGCSIEQACRLILDAADRCDAALADIEITRLRKKAAIAAATTNEEARRAAE